jgi:hypothetical protein
MDSAAVDGQAEEEEVLLDYFIYLVSIKQDQIEAITYLGRHFIDRT